MAMDDLNMSSTRPTAPVVGRHKKTQSLVGFDPLLASELNEAYPLAHESTPPEIAEEEEAPPDVTEVKEVKPEDLAAELRAIASELGKSSSPNRSANNPPAQEDEKKDLTQTPNPRLRASSRRLGASAASPSPSPAKQRSTRWSRQTPKQTQPSSTKKPGHQRTRSMPAVSLPWAGSKGRSPARPKKTTPAHSRASSRASLSSDMLQELWDLQEQSAGGKVTTSAPSGNTGGELSIPTLAKPRPTSFLTGTEVVLSSEADASEWQLEIPLKSEFTYTTRASFFLETYRAEKEGVLDLNNLVGCTSGDLAMFVGGKPTMTTNKLGETHRLAVESLLECGTDLLQVQGYFRSNPVDKDASNVREVFIVERQRQFLCVFRGTTAEQHGKVEKHSDSLKLSDNKNVSVLADRGKALQELEPQLFCKLDQLMEDNPFCDFVFAGHGFGGALATLAAYRYAWARPELRVAAVVTGNIKVGLPDFRLSANSLPNLKLVRVEVGQSQKAAHSNGVHVGHTIRINQDKKLGSQVKAFKFSDDGKPDPANPIRKLRFNNKEKTVQDYVNALDDLGETWVKDFFREDGAGVKGKDNETRQMV